MENSTTSRHTPRHELLVVIVACCMMVVMLTFGWLIWTRLENSKAQWQTYNHRVNTISEGMANIQHHVGYGGFIHHFQSMLLHRDTRKYAPLIEQDLASLNHELDRLQSVLILQENRDRVQVLRNNFAEYETRFQLALGLLATGRSSAEIALATAVEDATALKALFEMKRRASQLTLAAEQRVQQAHEDARQFMQVGGLLSLGFLLLATTVLLRQVRRLTQAKDDIEQQAQALRLARDEAQAGSRAKSAFVAAATHQLRTPMNAIIGFTQLLEADATLSPDHLDSVQEILKASRELLELINRVLAATDAEDDLPRMGTTRAAREPADLSPA